MENYYRNIAKLNNTKSLGLLGVVSFLWIIKKIIMKQHETIESNNIVIQLLLNERKITDVDYLFKYTDKYLVNFTSTSDWFGNDPLPATVEHYKHRLFIKWDNESTAVIDFKNVNIYKIL